MINILGAWFGDISAIKRPRGTPDPWADNERFCSATRAIRARCQRKARCYSPGADVGSNKPGTPKIGPKDGVTSELNGAGLCGYEPAPFANPRNKGVIVSYECVNPEGWKSIEFANPKQVNPGAAVLQARLRTGVAGEFSCQPPEPP